MNLFKYIYYNLIFDKNKTNHYQNFIIALKLYQNL